MDAKLHFNSLGTKVLKIVGVFLLIGIGLSFFFNTFALVNDHPVYYKREQESTYPPYNEHQIDELLSTRFEENSCLSRYDSLLHQRKLRKPSSYLVSKLRSYEERHRKCAPYSDLFNKTVALLKNNQSMIPSECKYNIWFPTGGLGNRMISLASSFLYALLTDRVFLIDPEDAISDLFCEPFPGGSWLLPLDFPLRNKFKGFKKRSHDSFGEMLRRNILSNSSSSSSLPPYVYAHVYSDYDDFDKRFYCDEEQSYVKDVPWTIMMSNEYFVPAFFMMPSFEEELHKLFPDKGTVFHLLSRYLFHPTNSVWELVTRFYEAYLLNSDVKIGIQIRIFHQEEGIPPHKVLNQIISCTTNEGLIPDINHDQVHERFNMTEGRKKIAVLLTSLRRDYFAWLRNMYWVRPTVTGEIVSIHQPSFEGHQDTGNRNHDRKALAEMYLLSLTDKLITSSSSTYGYVAQGLGGLTPWMVFKPKNATDRAPTCHRLLSMDPCFHMPPSYDCISKRTMNTSVIKPYIKQCEDRSMGVKLVEA